VADASNSDSNGGYAPSVKSNSMQAASGVTAPSTDGPSSSQSSNIAAAPVKSSGSILQRPDGVSDYLQQIRRPSLHMTVDSVNEGYKKKNRNSFEDSSIKIQNKNSTDFTRNGQVQSFEGPGFKLRTAVLTENTGGKVKTSVVTSQDSERNYTRSKDRLTQFVGTLDTDQFQSGALLTDHSNRVVSGSVRQTADGNRESRLRNQSADDLVRGSFLKTANLTIDARYQSNSFSDRQRLISDIVLGGPDSAGAASPAAPPSGSSQASAADDQQDDS
jgi:hypothetical protein